MVDKTVILRKLSELETYLKQIREFAGMPLQVYNADWRTQRIVERTLQMMIETCADIANHIVSDRGMRVPTGYADTFSVLMENAVINPDLSKIMEKMAKFRNVVVHQYEGVDAEVVIAILTKHLNDFERFREAILSYLNRPVS
ncbi:MAG: DUF86 domain-containing protein [Proteobacteria bacterium]|nr:DUF86 domain-containing protein [Pseudomonadota bacterium]